MEYTVPKYKTKTTNNKCDNPDIAMSDLSELAKALVASPSYV